MSGSDPLGRLPAELLALPQWVLAGADKVPLAATPGGALRAVSATRPSEWMTYSQARAAAAMHAGLVTTHTTEDGATVTRTGLDLGFVLHEADPYTCIDLDVKDAETHPGKPQVWTTPADFDRYVSIINTMSSYTERSRGKGIHIWVRGDIGRGYRRDGVEVYSRERYIIMTGNVYVNEPIQDRGQVLLNMIAQMRPMETSATLVELEPEVDDWLIFQMAATAANAEKFWKLHRGEWQDLGFPSQSEADLALMSMFTFYSDSNSQCRALFRSTALGQRDKARKDDRHLNYMLKLIRARQEREQSADLSALVKGADFVSAEREKALLAEAIAAAQHGSAPIVEHNREVANLAEPGTGDPPQAPQPAASAIAQLAPVPQRIASDNTGLDWPPGFVGAIARFVYENSFLPIKEVSVVAALGLMAGLCGKAWHIPQSGLNLYIILVARSAIGKEAMHSGIAALTKHASKLDPFFGNYVDFTEYVSGPALVKACLQQPSFVNVSGEWGRRLKRIAVEEGREGPLQSLRTQMTNLYQKSGPQSIAGGLGYSNAESNVASVAGVAYSMIGESTPGTFYESLTESMMEDGFLSRFLIVGYDGDRPQRNVSMLEVPDDMLIQALASLSLQAGELIKRGESMPVGRTEGAARIMAAFDEEAHGNITGTDDESRRQMWNRASLKAMRIAALLAVGDHYLSPCISEPHIEWAISLVRQDIAMMSKRLEQGDVGIGDKPRERKMVAILRQYLTAKKFPRSYQVNKKLHADGLVARTYIQQRTQQTSAFYQHKLGATKALDDTIATFISNGWLMECKQDSIISMYGHHGKTYRILELPDYTTIHNEED